jgi:fatty-acyl-CoA synthase
MSLHGKLDVKFAREAWIRALACCARIDEHPTATFPTLIDQLALDRGTAPALVSTEATLTYSGLAARANQYARWGLMQGLRPGEAVALICPNRAEYVAVWLGLTRIGAIVALINTQLAGEPLAHCIRVAAPRLIVVAAELAGTLASLSDRMPAATCWSLGASSQDMEPLGPALDKLSGDTLPPGDYRAPTLDATALYIYTSGTTGLPKAANVTHYRVLRWSQWFAGLLDTRPEDRLYNCLPLYHSVGGVVAVGAALAAGAAVVIRPRFSASDFWRDVGEERCTLFQYIGELCRYLVNAPPHPLERAHALRIACGNGLRSEVWETFETRFGIPRILEYYASTEGNFSLYNCEGRRGSIGRIPSYLAHRLPVALVRFDHESGEPVRNAAGFCERCGTDEAGEALGWIPDQPGARAGRFEGYADPEATGRKVLRNVFKPGDAWYRTGDLMRRDADGFFYFVDRVGETYRWKGENVSTEEVLGVLCDVQGVREGVVFGVPVPHTEGRAGMAALVVDRAFDPSALRSEVARRLPAYARPLFLRLLPALDSTGTFKPRKQDLQNAGFDPVRVRDPLYFDDPRVSAYVPLDAALYAAIAAGSIRL